MIITYAGSDFTLLSGSANRRLMRLQTDRYRNYTDLAEHEFAGIDYRISVIERPASGVAVIAPHAGKIERRTSQIARAIAGDDFNLYLFEGLNATGNFAALHITSCHFDEPSCLQLVAKCQQVIAIHGCTGQDERVLIGGLDRPLKASIIESLRDAKVLVETDGHRFSAVRTDNICNRGALKRGVQLELTSALRGGASEQAVVRAVRTALLRDLA
jgi:phage replication-related protein YjqB (UPF0714/DUF867 family)